MQSENLLLREARSLTFDVSSKWLTYEIRCVKHVSTKDHLAYKLIYQLSLQEVGWDMLTPLVLYSLHVHTAKEHVCSTP